MSVSLHPFTDAGEGMLRIKTRFGEDYYVHTLFFRKEWITISCIDKRTSSIGTPTLEEAAFNHLTACQKVKELHEQRSRREENVSPDFDPEDNKDTFAF